MGFHRIAIRIAAMEALASSAAFASGSGFATLAGPLVFDSRQDPIDHLDDIEAKPLVMLFTETDLGEPYGDGQHDPDKRTASLVCELQVASRGSIEMQKQDGSTEILGTSVIPVADAEHEARLDALEGQIEYALRWSPGGYLFRRFATIRRIESVPYRTASEKTRLAARTVSYAIEPVGTLFPDQTLGDQPTGANLLPLPLRDLAAALPAGSRNRLLIESLIGHAPVPAPLTAIVSIDSTVTVDGVVLIESEP